MKFVFPEKPFFRLQTILNFYDAFKPRSHFQKSTLNPKIN